MTDREPHRLCCTCFRRYVPLGTYKCPDCDPGRVVPNATATKRTAPKPLDLSKVPDEPTLADIDAYLAGEFTP